MQHGVDGLRQQFSTLVAAVEDAVEASLAAARNGGHGESAAQNLRSVRADWTKLSSYETCLQRHLEQQCAYHAFHQCVTDYETSVEGSFAEIRDGIRSRERRGVKEEAKDLFDSTQKLITLVLLWWRRADALIAQSRRVLPLGARRRPAEFKRPAVAIADWLGEVKINANDDIFVVEASSRDLWLVETLDGRRTSLPPLLVSMCGPDPEAIERALGIRLLLQANWTIALKDLGRSLISFLLTVFRQLNTEEVASFSEASGDSKDLRPLLEIMEQLLQTYWADHPDFEELRERMRKARMSLAIFDREEDIDDCTHVDINTLFLQMSPLVMHHDDAGASADAAAADASVTRGVLSLIMRKYQELAKYWEVYKMMTENSSDPNYFWMADEFHRQRVVGASELLDFMAQEDAEEWRQCMRLLAQRGGGGGGGKLPWQQQQQQQQQKSTTEPPAPWCSLGSTGAAHRSEVTVDIRGKLQQRQPSAADAAADDKEEAERVAVRRRVAEIESRRPPAGPQFARASSASSSTRSRASSRSNASRCSRVEELSKEEAERSCRMVISGVVDTSDKSVVSLEAAIVRGIIDWASGCYFNRAQSCWIPIQTALAKGLIVADSRTEGQPQVKKQRVYGMVTIRRLEPTLTVVAVRDTSSSPSGRLEPAEAQRRGLADRSLTRFLDSGRNEWLDFDAACARSIVECDLGDRVVSEDTFLVHSVADVAAGASVSFRLATERGLLDADEGVFYNSATGETLGLDEAIQEGFLKAKKVDNKQASEGSPAPPSVD